MSLLSGLSKLVSTSALDENEQLKIIPPQSSNFVATVSKNDIIFLHLSAVYWHWNLEKPKSNHLDHHIFKTVFDQIQYDANGLIKYHPNEHKFAMYSNFLIWILMAYLVIFLFFGC